HDQLASALFVDRDDQEEQREHVQCNRKGKGPDQQTERIFHFLQARRIRLVVFSIGLGFELSLTDYAIEDESDDERREYKQTDDYCDHIKMCSPLGRRLTARPRPRSSFTEFKAARSSRQRVSVAKIKFLRSASRRSPAAAARRQ